MPGGLQKNIGKNLNRVVKRTVHKERKQPAARKKLGLLEKHKDYKVRATKFHNKEKQIQALERKAAFRNPDEFNHKMLSLKKAENGTMQQLRKNKTKDELLLIDSQDARYVTMRKRIDDAQADRSKANLHMTGAKLGKHTLFVDEDEDLADDEVAERMGRDPRLLAAGVDVAADAVAAKPLADGSLAGYKEVFGRQERAKKLQNVLEHIELSSNLKKKGKRMAVEGKGGKKQYVWFRERSR